MRHGMKIGSIELEKGAVSAYVAFGASGLDVVVEATDDEGLAGLRRRIRGEVLVCEPALARSATAQGLTVGELPPEALAVKAALAVRLEHGLVMEHVAPSLLVELIAATIDFDAASAWDAFGPNEPIAIRFEPDDREVEGCVLGQAGEEYGLALYRHKGSVDRVMKLVAQRRPAMAQTLACTTVLIAHDGSCAVEAVRAMTGAAVAPLVIHMSGGQPSPVGDEDVAALVAALRAVTALADGGRRASGRTRDPEHPVVAHATRGSAGAATPRSTLDGVGRNEPCPCGSGKKFKRCHLGVVAAAPPTSARAALHTRDERIVANILAFGARRFGGEAIVRGLEGTFGGRTLSRQLVDPLVAYAWPIEGQPLAAHFRHAQRSRLDGDDRRWIELQLAGRLSIWEILRVERGKGVEAVDLLTGERCFVHEVMGTEILAPRDAILTRVVTDEIAVFCGIHESPLGPHEADEVIARFRESGLAPGDWAATVRLVELWNEVVAAEVRKAAAPMKVTNTDGHDVATIEDHFALARGALEPVFEKLAELDGAVVDEHDRKGARLTFTRPGNAMHALWENTIIGSARLTPTRLIVSTNSTERADALTARVCDALGNLASRKRRTREELPAMLGGESIAMDGQALGSRPSLEDAFRAWLDAPVRALAGRSPRDAVGDAAGRHAVHVLLKEMERRHARKPMDGLDSGQLRRELGLDELGHPRPDRELDRALGAGRKLSETLLDFVRPMIDADRGLVDERGMRALLGFAVLVWNAVVTEEEEHGSARFVAEARALLTRDRPFAEGLAWFDRLVARKRERFGGDLRIVGNWDVRRSRDRLDIQMETRVAPTLQARLSAAALLP